MKTYEELTVAEAVGLSLNATACNPVRFAFKDRGESTVWTEAKLLGVNLRSEFPFSSSLGCGTELCAQIVEEKLDPVASGYNPRGLKESEVGVSEGWRLLTKEEHVPDRWIDNVCYFNGDAKWSRLDKWKTGYEPLRTKKPAGFYLPKPDVLVAWTQANAPAIGATIIRRKSSVGRGSLVLGWGTGGPRILVGAYSYEFLLTEFEHSLDGGKTWSACGSKEVAK